MYYGADVNDKKQQSTLDFVVTSLQKSSQHQSAIRNTTLKMNNLSDAVSRVLCLQESSFPFSSLSTVKISRKINAMTNRNAKWLTNHRLRIWHHVMNATKFEIILSRRHMTYGHPFGVTRILKRSFTTKHTRSGDFILSLAKWKKGNKKDNCEEMRRELPGLDRRENFLLPIILQFLEALISFFGSFFNPVSNFLLITT